MPDALLEILAELQAQNLFLEIPVPNLRNRRDRPMDILLGHHAVGNAKPDPDASLLRRDARRRDQQPAGEDIANRGLVHPLVGPLADENPGREVGEVALVRPAIAVAGA